MDTIAHIIRQGVDMGIHCYMFHIHRKYTGFDELMSILSSFPGCAFLCFSIHAINESISRAISLKNVMLLLKPEDEPGNQEAAKLLIQSGCLCGCFARYSSRGPIRDDSFLIPAEKLGFSLCA